MGASYVAGVGPAKGEERPEWDRTCWERVLLVRRWDWYGVYERGRPFSALPGIGGGASFCIPGPALLSFLAIAYRGRGCVSQQRGRAGGPLGNHSD